MGIEMTLLATVKPGTVQTNFAQFKDLLKKEMEENYKSIVVTDEGLQFARDARATLNKAKTQLKSTVSAAKKSNEEPLKVAIEQSKELEAILDDAISTLDEQIKKIETARRQKKMDNALKVLAQKVDRLEPELIKYASECMGWLENPKWGLTGITLSELSAEIDEKINRIKQAWELFQGDFRQDMLDEFSRSGDLGKAQLLGLQKQKDFEEAERRKAERLAKEAAEAGAQVLKQDTLPKTEEKQTPQEPIRIVYDEPQDSGMSMVVKSPDDYQHLGDRKCHADFRVSGPRYKIQWLLDLCKDQQIGMERLDK